MIGQSLLISLVAAVSFTGVGEPDLKLTQKASTESPSIAQNCGNYLSSWYGPGFHGRKTANGEVFNRYGLSVAHKTLPFGTVINANGVQVRVNDRGPFAGARVFDFSEAAAKRIRTTSGDTLYQAGVGYVNICF
jgi:rare lipoprotein A (peptidoglycan hydrolase)